MQYIHLIHVLQTYQDELRLYYDNINTTRVNSIAFIGPGYTTYSYLNSGYRIYTFDGNYNGSSHAILDGHTYYLNITGEIWSHVKNLNACQLFWIIALQMQIVRTIQFGNWNILFKMTIVWNHYSQTIGVILWTGKLPLYGRCSYHVQ